MTDELYEVPVKSFPKLKNCGGFKLLRCIPSTRDLELIPSPSCYSPHFLRNRIGTARIYIRPIQTYLDLDDVDADMKVNDVSYNNYDSEIESTLCLLLQVTEVYLKCKRRIPYSELRSHIESCKSYSR